MAVQAVQKRKYAKTEASFAAQCMHPLIVHTAGGQGRGGSEIRTNCLPHVVIIIYLRCRFFLQ